MVAMTFAGRGDGRQRGRGRGAGRGQQRGSETTSAPLHVTQTYEEYRDMPCRVHLNANGKATHTNRHYKFVNDLKEDPESGYKQSRKNRPRGKGKGKKKEEESKDSSDMDEDVDPKHAAKSDDKGKNTFAKKALVYHTLLGTPIVRQQKTSLRILMATLPLVPQYLRWSEVPITWDRTDHLDLVPTENQYAMVINPLIDDVEFTKCMVDNGSSINIMYLDTLQKMNLTEANLRRTNTIFHGVVPGREARSLGCITLQVAFGDVNNYRQECMTFEVVPFKSVYHVIFGRDIFHTIMAKPCFVYNKLKIPGPNGVVTVSGSFTKARDCEINEAAIAEAVLYSEEFKEIQSN